MTNSNSTPSLSMIGSSTNKRHPLKKQHSYTEKRRRRPSYVNHIFHDTFQPHRSRRHALIEKRSRKRLLDCIHTEIIQLRSTPIKLPINTSSQRTLSRSASGISITREESTHATFDTYFNRHRDYIEEHHSFFKLEIERLLSLPFNKTGIRPYKKKLFLNTELARYFNIIKIPTPTSKPPTNSSRKPTLNSKKKELLDEFYSYKPPILNTLL